MTLGSSFWLTRAALPLLTVLAAVPGFVLPADAQVSGRPAAALETPVPGLTSEWWLGTLNAQQAWGAAPEQGAGVTAAVLSTGVAPQQPDLTANVLTGPDYTGSGRSQGNPFWGNEGTAVASLIAGHGHGSAGTRGITGVAPLARVLSLRVTLDYKDPLISDADVVRHLPDAIARGIQYAVGQGAKVIALPLDPATLSPAGAPSPAIGGGAAEQAAVRDALAHNVVMVAPAGDDAVTGGGPDYPAAYPGVIAVGATGRDGQLAPFSSTRSYVALTAPGSALAVAAPDGGYTTLSTTDMAAALTAGVVALIRSRYPKLTAAQITQAVERGVVPANPKRPGTGGGALNAASAITDAARMSGSPGEPGPSPPPTRNRFPQPGKGQPGEAGGQGLLTAAVLRDAAAVAGALVAALAIAGLLVRRRRRRRRIAAAVARRGAATGPRRAGGAPRHGKSPGGRARGQADPGPPLRPAGGTAPPAASSESPAARAVTADALFSRSPAAVHPPWEVASRLGVAPESGASPPGPMSRRSPRQEPDPPTPPPSGEGSPRRPRSFGHG